MIGYVDVKTASGVSFFVKRSTNYGSAGSVIPYELEQLNIGKAMKLATGVFTTPVNGRYYFSFTAESGSNSVTHPYLRVNGVVMASSYAPSTYYNLPSTNSSHF